MIHKRRAKATTKERLYAQCTCLTTIRYSSEDRGKADLHRTCAEFFHQDFSAGDGAPLPMPVEVVQPDIRSLRDKLYVMVWAAPFLWKTTFRP